LSYFEQRSDEAVRRTERMVRRSRRGRKEDALYAAFPLREAAAAHALMETSQHIGKIVLTN